MVGYYSPFNLFYVAQSQTIGGKIHNVLDLIANLFTVLQQKDFFAYMHHNRKVVQVYCENELHDECFSIHKYMLLATAWLKLSNQNALFIAILIPYF